VPREWKHMFVVYRFAGEFSDERRGTDPNIVVTIKEVLDTEREAIAEVSRLTSINSGTGSRYFYQAAKYYPGGRKPQ